jgi:hypothetical protein
MIDPETKVSEILKSKKGDIKKAPLPPGSPPWEDIADLTWGEIVAGAKLSRPGFRTVRKLLTDKDYDR